MTPEEEVVAAAQARADALARADADSLMDLLHPDFRWTTHTGATFDRAAYVARNTDGRTAWKRQDLGNPAVVVVGDAAVLRATVADTIVGIDGEEIFRMPVTQVWVRDADGWRCLAGHAGPRLGTTAVTTPSLVVVTGLPASGKSTLGRGLAARLQLPLLDKDDLLEALMDELGSPDPDARGRLSRAADEVLLSELHEVPSAVVVNWWNDRSLERLRALGKPLIEVHCDCSFDVARERFMTRRRHPGHHDDLVTPQEHDARAARLRETWRGPLGLGPLVVVDTSTAVNVDEVVSRVRAVAE